MGTAFGSPVPDLLADFCHRFICGAVPPIAAVYFAGARLIALVKKDTTHRPIAVGDTLRRLAAKLLSAAHRKQIRTVLESASQVGVGTPSAIDGICLSIRRLAPEHVLKIDLVNAFNRTNRQAIFNACAAECPSLLPYAIMVYGNRPRLFLGSHEILSADGTQQGDPLASILFSLVLAHCISKFNHAGISFKAWYLDDGSIAGTPESLRAFLDFLIAEGPAYGLHVNINKCEIVSREPSATTQLFSDIPSSHHFTFDDWELLGTAMGSSSSQVDTVVDRAIRKVRLIASLPDPHVAFTLLRFCAGSTLVNHLMRSFGPHPSFARLDNAVVLAVQSIGSLPQFGTPEETLNVIAQIHLPVRLGGLGLRSAGAHAAAAHISAVCASRLVAPIICPSHASLPPLDSDPRVQECLATSSPTCLVLPPVALALARERLQHVELEAKKRFQRALSEIIDQSTLDSLSLTHAATARFKSCSASGAILSLPHPDDEPKDLWLPAEMFTMLLRYRLGLPVDTRAHPCTICNGKHISDQYGNHSLSCMTGGNHTTIHNAMRNIISKLASYAGFSPRLEPTIASTSKRGDILLRRAGETWNLVDVAVINPLGASNIAAAMNSVGGACHEYAKHKFKSYTALTAEAGWKLSPLVVDTLGAWDPDAIPLLRQIFDACGERFGVPRHRRMTRYMRQLQMTLARQVTETLARNTPASRALPCEKATLG